MFLLAFSKLSILNYLMLLFLCTQIIIFVLIIIPLPLYQRKPFMHWLTSSGFLHKIINIQIIVFIFGFLLFLSSMQGLMRAESDLHNYQTKLFDNSAEKHFSEFEEISLRGRLFWSQRNAYLNGFTLFVTVVLNRFVNFLKYLNKREEEADLLESHFQIESE